VSSAAFSQDRLAGDEQCWCSSISFESCRFSPHKGLFENGDVLQIVIATMSEGRRAVVVAAAADILASILRCRFAAPLTAAGQFPHT
jgi:hypothetical protein